MTDQQLQQPSPDKGRLLKELAFAVLAVLFIIGLLKLGVWVLDRLHLGKTTVVAEAPGVTITPDKVKVVPRPTKKNPSPQTIELGKAPDDKVHVDVDENGETRVTIDRLALVFEPTVGKNWNGKVSKDFALEDALGLRVIKWSNVGLGPFVTTTRFGGQLDYRLGNLTGAAGIGFDFLTLAPGAAASVNLVPF